MRKKRGFTLIEILFAVFLVVVCAYVFAATMPIANTSRAKASDLDKAMGLCQKQLEAIRGLGYANCTPTQLLSFGLVDSATPLTGTTDTYSFTNSDNANLDNPGLILTNGSGTVRIEQLDIDLRRVTVTVTWRDRVQYKNFAVGTLIANL